MERITTGRAYRAEMPNLMIKCPKTGDAVPTGISLESGPVVADNFKGNSFGPCASCGETHRWDGSEAFLDT